MGQRNHEKTLAEWKEDIRKALGWFYQIPDPALIEARKGKPIKVKLTKEMHDDLKRQGLNTRSGKNEIAITTVFDPVVVEVKDQYGGTLTCTYDISRTLHGIRKTVQQWETYTDSEIADLAERLGISISEAMAKVATRYVEAETFAILKIGRLIHDELKSVLQESVNALLIASFLSVSQEYGIQIVNAEKILKELATKSLVNPLKRRSKVVRRGAPKGSKHVLTPMSKAQFYERLEAFTVGYERANGKPPSVLQAAKALGFGSGKTMQRRRQDWGDERKWSKLMDDILLPIKNYPD